jgi:Rrf2 family nitric oxide-sensitive transcriptional repressor
MSLQIQNLGDFLRIMLMKFSKKTDMAIHGLWCLAMHEGKGTILVSEIAEMQNVSASYLEKIFQLLVKAGFVESIRGKNGGFLLAKKPQEISLSDVLKVTELDEPMFECLGDKRECRVVSDCRIKQLMNAVSMDLLEKFSHITLADLITRAEGSPHLFPFLKEVSS